MDLILTREADSSQLALPVPDSALVSARYYGMSLWGQTAKIMVRLPSGKPQIYFMKVRTCFLPWTSYTS
jgi:hypothetical protein